MPYPTLMHFVVCTATTTLAAQQYLVVPANYATADAPAYGWIAGASRDVRQQTLIGSAHIAALVSKTITAIEFRRNAAPEQYLGGTANVTLTLSIAPGQPLDCSPNFAVNAGQPGPAAFTGLMKIPISPMPTGASVGWTPSNIIHIALTSPFTYLGGTLCVDLIGHPMAGQNANWWMADLALEDITGTSTDLGGGCGTYGGTTSNWSSISHRSLLPGAHASFYARGIPNGLALAVFGNSAPFGIPLSATGLPSSAGCDLWLSSIAAIMPAVFGPIMHPDDHLLGGDAGVDFKIPNSPAVFGITMTTQWLDLTQMATSNAIEWTVAPTSPAIDMVLIEGDPSEATGNAAVYMGHVIRFTYQ
jgi:hypothetical protein